MGKVRETDQVSGLVIPRRLRTQGNTEMSAMV